MYIIWYVLIFLPKFVLAIRLKWGQKKSYVRRMRGTYHHNNEIQPAPSIGKVHFKAEGQPLN